MFRIRDYDIVFDTRVQNKCVDTDICTFSLAKYEKHKTKFGFVFNLDEHTESGSHWVALFVDVRDEFIYHFDSTGRKIPRQIHALVQRIVEEGKTLSLSFSVHDNHKKRHQYLFTECGMFCLCFLITMLDSSLT
jgi:Ulp1 protease family, C-terminal catalytic domain